ncbi:MAG: VCBS repeat-containing protein [Planctomycetota bacterium]
MPVANMPVANVLVASVLGPIAPIATAQTDESLASYFGFDEQRIIVVDDGAGPVTHGDFNSDGRPDIAIANNRKSRIEIHTLRERPRTDAELERDVRVNEIRPSRYFDRVDVSVRHRVDALLAMDLDGDERLDLVYGSRGSGVLVSLRQPEPGRFQVAATKRLPELQATPAAMEVVRDEHGRPAIACIVEQRLTLIPIGAAGQLGPAQPIAPAAPVRAVFVEDYDGDGLHDVLTAVPTDDAPLRVWLQRPGVDRSRPMSAAFPAELRFEMPNLIEVEPVRVDGRDAASIAVIEQGSRRVILYDLVTTRDPSPDVETQAEVAPFPDGSGVLLASDLDLDGFDDLLMTRPNANALVVAFGASDGAGPGVEFPTFKGPQSIAAGRWPTSDREDTMGVFVLSEAENAVGVSRVAPGGGLTFPAPIALRTGGGTPESLSHIELGTSGPAVAVMVRKRRDLFLEVHFPSSTQREPIALELERVSKTPEAVRALDVDRDGHHDLLLLTPGEPLIMVMGGAAGGFDRVVQSDDMPQFGLVSSAGPTNTIVHDADNDGYAELLFATDNFLRSVAYDAPSESAPGGWRVVDQDNDPDPSTRFVGLTRLGDQEFLAADAARGRLVTFERAGDDWRRDDAELRVRGVELGRIIEGPFGQGGARAVLAVGSDGYAVVPRRGARRTLREVAIYRSDEENRLEHEIEVGDVNSDGYPDLVILDAGEQMCQVLTLSASRRLFEATEFKVFESRLFQGGDQREFEPSGAIVADFTDDGHDDILVLVHDRVIIYPQQRP